MFPYYCLGFVALSDDIRFANVLSKTPRTSIRFEGGNKRKYVYGVSYRSLFRAPVNGKGWL